mmetsp:Transcript_28591/g.60985  ORF Transcript_28591/g.60985 Transcript_28591/m.60985 type:complete len:302 (+) Transcript_28591:127-1032(+)|eukprot:CAMPEP_0172312128 /NCGR_PEP_ID=MMETSP1058-20130122/16743_1 /TAXON_ID=83371 /ORGANISM="Detonula confervacea, Strain CCMP 353" /LENGTH=301 /DNA_ID=CAMNT_0013025497 /DNA_START=38 /DNA_END=943 /DNA_ORIENTATION=+
MSTKETQFDSEGFDLGATAEDGEGGVVYEIGGGVTTTTESQPKKAKESHGPTDESERLKGLGNNEFKLGNHLDAYDYYTEAIEACPSGEGIGPTGKELLQLRDEFEEQNREQMMEQQHKEMEKRRTTRNSSSANSEDKKEEDEKEKEEEKPSETFSPPRHLYGPKLAVYHANRAATLLHLGRNGEVIEDCDISLLYNPTYAKAYSRRCTAHERIENTEESLKDAQKALEFDPTNKAARKNVDRLQKIENERLEKLKEETMGKLKDLGNSLLSNFGLSLDNFNAVQDPNSGGYSISFDQNKK